MAWGLQTQHSAPAEQLPTNGTEVMFLASIGIVFAGTMAAVLIAHDGISRDRVSGVLEVRLSQPMPRWRQGVVLMLGHWSSIAVPVAVLLVVSMFLVGHRSGMWMPLSDALIYIAAAMLILLWYTVFALLASSIAKEQGSAIAFSIGLWFLFTLLWVLFTTLLAALNGVQLATLKIKDTSCLRGAWICFLQMESITIFWKPDWTG